MIEGDVYAEVEAGFAFQRPSFASHALRARIEKGKNRGYIRMNHSSRRGRRTRRRRRRRRKKRERGEKSKTTSLRQVWFEEETGM